MTATTTRITARIRIRNCQISHQPVRSRSCSLFALSANAIHMFTSPTMPTNAPRIPVGSTWLVTGSTAT
jgi:hypothetical protein